MHHHLYRGMYFRFKNKIYRIEKINRKNAVIEDSTSELYNLDIEAIVRYGEKVDSKKFAFADRPVNLSHISSTLKEHERNKDGLRVSTAKFVNFNNVNYRYVFFIEAARIYDMYGIDDSILERIEISYKYRSKQFNGRFYSRAVRRDIKLPTWWKVILRVDEERINAIPTKITLHHDRAFNDRLRTFQHEIAHLVTCVLYGYRGHGALFKMIFNEIQDSYPESAVLAYAKELEATQQIEQQKTKVRAIAAAKEPPHSPKRIGGLGAFKGFRRGTKLSRIWQYLNEGCYTKNQILEKLNEEFGDSKSTLQVQLSHYKRGKYEWKLEMNNEGILSLNKG